MRASHAKHTLTPGQAPFFLTSPLCWFAYLSTAALFALDLVHPSDPRAPPSPLDDENESIRDAQGPGSEKRGANHDTADRGYADYVKSTWKDEQGVPEDEIGVGTSDEGEGGGR